MPKIVNHEEKKEQIAAATWRVILRGGMKGATVRSIAKEADISLGALRHYFSTQDELLAYAMQLVRERANARIQAILSETLPPKTMVRRVLFEIVPLNEDTRAEMDVWLAYVFSLGRKADSLGVQQEIYSGIRKMIEYLDHRRLLREDLDKELTAETLYSLVDGLAMHAFLEPRRLTKERTAAVLTSYLDSICIEEA
ncbi:TetR family transcriptional regulator [Paenibacillus antri]|uniref:TetR family transcriptional regulator n=1 Tax=Paenibacillus antri TaxID=2582848 RepID=A0A5R9G3K6_9BACL|nr:TetR family transcriptional regulator C-terminal domain-containing protein [Paenibacillus antri]TLS50942.1 TetR family transcriptional regulator [Paenibacillus antri]